MIRLALLLLAPALTAADWFQEFQKSATPQELYQFLWAVPKGGDLHNHFTLAIHAEQWYAAATRAKHNEFYTRVRFQNCEDSTEPAILSITIQRSTYAKLSDCRKQEYVALRNLDERQKQHWLSSLKLDKPGEGRNEFFEVLIARLSDMARDPWLAAELLVENMRFYGEQGLRYLEAQFNVARMQDTEGRLLAPNEVSRIVREALAGSDAKATGVTARFQITVIRYTPSAEQSVEEAYQFVDANRDLWVGINMAGREDNDKGHPLRFLEVFRRMRRTYTGIQLSIHGGEVDSPGDEVRRTLLLGATRIGHGINLITDPEGMLLMRNRRALIETSLVSNKLLEYTPDLDKHPFPEYLRTGIPVCLNTDDPGAWDSNITDEYFLAVRHFRLSWREIVQIGRDSLSYSFVEEPVKQRLLREYDAAIKDFETNWKQRAVAAKPKPSGYAIRNFGL